MERDNIIKALECCLVECNCTCCPLYHQYETDCLKYAGEKALSLIKELTEENEGLSQSLANSKLILANYLVGSSKEKLERITVIVREHLDDDPFEKAIADANGAEPKGSTVGVKISVGGEQYGTYVCFKQSTLSAAEVAEAINEQFETLLNGWEETE